MTIFVVTAVVGAAEYLGWVHLARLYDIFPQLMFVTLALGMALSLYVYLISFMPDTRIAPSGNSGKTTTTTTAKKKTAFFCWLVGWLLACQTDS